MMAEIINPEETTDSPFEVVQSTSDDLRAASNPITADHPSVPSSSSVGRVSGDVAPAAPSALPAFARMPPEQTASVAAPPLNTATWCTPRPEASVAPCEPSPLATHQRQSVASGSAPSQQAPNPFSVRASAGGQSLSSVVHASPHVPHTTAVVPQPPPPAPTRFFPPTQPAGVYDTTTMQTGLDVPFEVSGGSGQRQPCDPGGPLSLAAAASYGKSSGPAGVWNWVNKTISQSDFLSKVAEKAKTSVDTVLTTLDPQLKDYMNANGALELFVISADADTVAAVKCAFCRHVPNLIIRGVPPAHSPNVAQQPVGFENGIRAAKEYVQAVRNCSLVSPNSLVVGCSSLVVQFFEQNWYEFTCVVMNNGANVDLYAFSQPTFVPTFALDVAKHQTPVDYPLASSGFARSIDEVVGQSHGQADWRLQYAGVSKQELVTLACSSLAYSYKTNFC